MIKSIKTKLSLGFSSILILLCLLGAFSGYALHATQQTTQQIHDKNLMGLSAIDNINGLMNINFSNILYALIYPQSEVAQTLPKSIKDNSDVILGILENYKDKYAVTDDEKQAADRLLSQQHKLFPLIKEFLQYFQTHTASQSRNFYFNEVHDVYKQFFIYQDQLAHLQATNSDESYQAAQQTAQQGRMIIIVSVLAALVLTLIITLLVIRMITRPLAQANNLTRHIANGKLDNAENNPFNDEFGTMIDAIYDMQHRLAATVLQVRDNAQAVHDGVTEVDSRNTDLSSRTQQQAASLEQTAASMEEISSTVKKNADNTEQANRLTQQTRQKAQQGDEVIQGAQSAMAEIAQASEKITEIISLIDNIAFQTNLLALNASVEAARAGEHGRGFAVVAAEVRKLASRSADAATDIANLVNNSTEKVAQGSKQVELSSQTLHDIVESIKQVSHLVSEMATAGNEQASGIDQINLAISQMDSATQANSTLVDQTKAAGHQLLAQAQELRQQMDYFQISKTYTQTKTKALELIQ